MEKIEIMSKYKNLIDKIDKDIYATYHSPKNKEVLPIFIFFGAFALICNGMLLYEMIIWGIYYWYCNKNNEELNNNQKNLEKREYLINFKERILNGECKYINYK